MSVVDEYARDQGFSHLMATSHYSVHSKNSKAVLDEIVKIIKFVRGQSLVAHVFQYLFEDLGGGGHTELFSAQKFSFITGKIL